MHTAQVARGVVGQPKAEGVTKPLLMVTVLPVMICVLTVLMTMFRQGTPYHAAPTPQFDAAYSVGTIEEARKIPVGIRQFRVARVISPATSYKIHCRFITEDGTQFVAQGRDAKQIKPGFVFSARIQPFALYAKQRIVWLEEYNPEMSTDAEKLLFPQTAPLKRAELAP